MDLEGLTSYRRTLLHVLVGIVLMTAVPGDAAPITSKEDAVAFLQDKGYMSRENDVDQYTTALSNFQKFYQLPLTGVLDNETLSVMNENRCGNPDIYITMNDIDFSRYKRFVAYQGWGRTHITYDVGRYSKQLTREDVDKALKQAFQIYEDDTILTFERKTNGEPDIMIHFFEPYGPHGDGRPFDGRGGELAHAFYPFFDHLSGDIHFDDGERWSINREGENLVAVAAHEIGHSLGLAHSKVLGSVMYPVYFTNWNDLHLHEDDILGIVSLYGNGMTTMPNTRTEEQPGANNPNVPNLCRESMDAIIATDQGELIILKGSYVWRATENGIKKGYPRLISQRWAGLQNKLETGTQLKNTFFWSENAHDKLLFTKGKSLWRYSQEQELDESFPQDINKLLGMRAFKLNNLVGMFEMRQNGDIYLFEESRFYIYNWLGIVQGPFSTREVFRQAPSNIAAIFQWTDNKIYFFTRNGLIYKYNSEDFSLDGSPSSWFSPRKGEADWLSCSTKLIKGESGAEALRPLQSVMVGVLVGIIVRIALNA